LAVEDLVKVLEGALIDGRLSRETVAVLGPEEMLLGEAARRVGKAIGRRPAIVPAPVWFHYALALLLEMAMRIPLVSRAQVRILSEGIVEALPPCAALPADLLPVTRFSDEEIRAGLPEAGAFGFKDLRCCA
jgi:NADH dehydrogenase